MVSPPHDGMCGSEFQLPKKLSEPTLESKNRDSKGHSPHNSFMGISIPRKAVSFQASTAKQDQQSKSRGVPRDLLPDADEMKRNMVATMTKKRYDVSDFYKPAGLAQQIARDHRLEQLTLLVVVLNALYLWIDADYNHEASLYDSDIGFQITENAFCIYFFGELFIRFLAFARKRDCIRDAWFVFDSILVLLMVAETWIMTYVLRSFGIKLTGGGMGNSGILRLLRLLRLSRMSRMARVLRSVPALLVLVKGIAAASSACIFSALLLIIAMYLWALALKQLGQGTSFQKKYFPDIPNGMYNLMLGGCFLKGFDEAMDEIVEESVLCSVVYFSFVLLSGVAIMKMLTGMLCKVINAVATSETEAMTVVVVKETLVHIMLALGHVAGTGTSDVDTGNLTIERSMFYEMMNDAKAIAAFAKIGVDPVSLLSSIDFIFPDQSGKPKDNVDEPKISFSDFMEKILQLRGSNTATVQDVVEIRKFIRSAFRYIAKVYGRSRIPSLPVPAKHVRENTASHVSTVSRDRSHGEQVFEQYRSLSKAEKSRFMYLLASSVNGLGRDKQMPHNSDAKAAL